MKPNSVRIIKSKGIYQPENLVSNGSSRHDDAAQAKQIKKSRSLCNDTDKGVTKNILTKFPINK